MDERKPGEHPLEGLERRLAEREERRRRRDEAWVAGFWSGLRILGQAGWSVVVPGLMGLAAGFWIHSRWPSGIPWPVIGLTGGTVVGFISIWNWLSREHREMGQRTKEGSENDSRP